MLFPPMDLGQAKNCASVTAGLLYNGSGITERGKINCKEPACVRDTEEPCAIDGGSAAERAARCVGDISIRAPNGGPHNERYDSVLYH
jgi:hypothetical protein